jgi:hypothetical protein
VRPIMEDTEIRTLVTRLARPDASGGGVIERAAILAEGADCDAVLAWLAAHGAVPEEAAPVTAGRGLHSTRLDGIGGASQRAPRRYRLPPGALG